MRRCILSLATADKRFPAGLRRLRESARRTGYAGEFMFWPPGQFPAGCPAHDDVPFAFKPYCFREAQGRGAQLALWLDAACVVLESLAPHFRQIEERGYLLFQNQAHRLGEWASDEALDRLGLSREEALALPEVNAAAIGLNLEHPLAGEFLDQWQAEARHGTAFRGARERLATPTGYLDMKWNRGGRASADPRVRGHRHDQTVAGALAARLGMSLAATGLQARGPKSRRICPQTVILVDRYVARSNAPLAPLEWLFLEKNFSRWLGRLRRFGGRGAPVP